jgi:hypothetical protein
MMALVWSYAFGPESKTDLDAMGFAFTSGWNFVTSTAADEVYSYAGSDPRYSMTPTFTGSNANRMNLPAVASSGILNAGWMCIAVKIAGSSTWPVTSLLLSAHGVASKLEVRVSSGGNTLLIYFGNSLRASTPAYDWQDFHYVAFRYQYPSLEADIYVDGVLAASYAPGSTQPAANGLAVWNPGNNTNRACLAQIITWDAATPVATATQPYFVTRISPDEDVAGSGTWSPAANPGAPAQAPNLVSPYNTATTVADATPVTGDKIIVATDGNASTTLNTRLGTTVTAPASGAPSVAGVTCHTWSIGDGVTDVKAGIKDAGAATTVYGTPITVDAAVSTYIVASSDTQPGGGAWTGATPSPDLVYEVD